MRSLARFLGVLVMVIGAVALVAPSQLIAFGDDLLTPSGMYAIAAIRVVVGLIIAVAGLGTPLFGAGRSRQIFDWWVSQGPMILHVPGVLLIAIGAGLTYLTGTGRKA